MIGHSPHMPQAIGKITTTEEEGGVAEEKLAFFSLGNFILRPDYIMPSQAHTTIVPKLDINAESNIMNVTIYTVRIDNDGIPYLEEKRKNDIISKVAKASDEEFYTSVNVHDNVGQISVKLQPQE